MNMSKRDNVRMAVKIIDREHAKAKRRLEQAAPWLLAEAESFLTDFEQYIDNDDYDLPDPSGLRAAIARAKGGATPT